MRILLAFLLMLMVPIAFGEVLQAGVKKEWTIDDARLEAMRGFSKRISTFGIPKIDPHLAENLQARVEKNYRFPDRVICVFTNGSYSVTYYGDIEGYYYTNSGRLFQVQRYEKYVELNPPPEYFPIKFAVYSYPSGVISAYGFTTLNGEQDFAFNPNGELQLYCKDSTCYNSRMQVTSHRASSQE